MIRKLLIATVTACSIVAGALCAPATADTSLHNDQLMENHDEYAGMEPEDILEEGLESEGLVLEEAEIGIDGIEVEAYEDTTESEFSFSLELEPGESTGTATVTDEVNGEIVTKTYDLLIEESTTERAIFTLTDTETGETLLYDSASVTPSVAFAIPIAFAGISVSVALYYIALGAAIVIGGILLMEAAKAVPRIIDYVKKSKATVRQDYYPAHRRGSLLFINPKGITFTQAKTRGRAKGDVWAISSSKARTLAQALNTASKPIGPEYHGKGLLYHYHPAKKTPNMHAFYGLPVK